MSKAFGTLPFSAKDVFNFLSILGALLALNTLLSFHNIWPTPWIRFQPEISVEAIAIVTSLSLLKWKNLAKNRGVHYGLTSILIVLIIGRYLDVTAPALYGRPINFYWDGQHIPRVAAMLIENTSNIVLIVTGLCISIGLGLLVWSSSKIVSVLTSSGKSTQAWLAGIGTLGLLLYAIGMLSNSIKSERAFSIPISLMYMRQALFFYEAAQIDKASKTNVAKSQDFFGAVEFDERDFHIVFLESYGTTVFQNPAYFSQIEPSLKKLSLTAKKYGWHSSTGAYQVPTFGGASWLSHATLMSGQWISSNSQYHKLLTTNSITLNTWFQNSGYRAIALLPGLRLHWPEGKFYGYDKIWNAESLKYPGPAFGWWEIPDQYSLGQFYKHEAAAELRKPIFTLFATITSHMPFHPLPPIEENWLTLLSSKPYPDISDISQPTSGLYGKALHSAYNKAIIYDLHLVADLLRLTSHQNPLIIVLGDHQPPAMIAGVDAPWTVPVHVFSQKQETLEKLGPIGFVEGLIPNNVTLGRLDELNQLILNVVEATKTVSNHYPQDRAQYSKEK